MFSANLCFSLISLLALRFNEPTCVKHIKMELLALVANDANTSEIVAELAEYVSDVNADMARHAIRSIAQVRAYWQGSHPLPHTPRSTLCCGHCWSVSLGYFGFTSWA